MISKESNPALPAKVVKKLSELPQRINDLIFSSHRNEGFPLVVHFNLKFYPRRHPLDVRDLEEVLKSNRTIDPDSVRIQEGEMLTALMQVG